MVPVATLCFTDVLSEVEGSHCLINCCLGPDARIWSLYAVASAKVDLSAGLPALVIQAGGTDKLAVQSPRWQREVPRCFRCSTKSPAPALPTTMRAHQRGHAMHHFIPRHQLAPVSCGQRRPQQKNAPLELRTERNTAPKLSNRIQGNPFAPLGVVLFRSVGATRSFPTNVKRGAV